MIGTWFVWDVDAGKPLNKHGLSYRTARKIARLFENMGGHFTVIEKA
jgi:hypothetical protein